MPQHYNQMSMPPADTTLNQMAMADVQNFDPSFLGGPPGDASQLIGLQAILQALAQGGQPAGQIAQTGSPLAGIPNQAQGISQATVPEINRLSPAMRNAIMPAGMGPLVPSARS